MPRDYTLWILVAGLLVYTAIIIAIAIVLPGNEKLYALIAGILGNFSGALFMYFRGQGPGPTPPPPAPGG